MLVLYANRVIFMEKNGAHHIKMTAILDALIAKVVKLLFT